ncbi:hypothetical protein FQR65_LT20748 [Abscondita terminalis]|nr:hypothetical protein FQR65_LT20748 [Abscondita terminalis]
MRSPQPSQDSSLKINKGPGVLLHLYGSAVRREPIIGAIRQRPDGERYAVHNLLMRSAKSESTPVRAASFRSQTAQRFVRERRRVSSLRFIAPFDALFAFRKLSSIHHDTASLLGGRSPISPKDDNWVHNLVKASGKAPERCSASLRRTPCDCFAINGNGYKSPLDPSPIDPATARMVFIAANQDRRENFAFAASSAGTGF